MSTVLELNLRETRAVRAALVEAHQSGVQGTDLVTVPAQGRLRVDAAAIPPICRALSYVAGEVPVAEMRTRLGVARPELDALFARVVARWVAVSGL